MKCFWCDNTSDIVRVNKYYYCPPCREKFRRDINLAKIFQPKGSPEWRQKAELNNNRILQKYMR